MALPTFAAGEALTAAKLTQICTEVAGSTIVAVKSTSQTVNNSASLTDDFDLLVALAASTTYAFEAAIIFTAQTTPDLKVAFSFPTGATCQWGAIRLVTAATLTGDADFGSYSSAASGSSTIAAAGTGAPQLALVKGSITLGSTAGNLRLQWAQNAANASDAIVHGGSTLTAWKD